VVLCAAIQRTQRRLAEEHDVWLLSYQPGEEEDVIDAITAQKRTPVAETIA
jgi:hypothetical protein